MGRPGKYSPEMRERAVRLVFDYASDHPSQWAAIRSVAEKIGCFAYPLRRRRDTKSRSLYGSVGSIPSSGTKFPEQFCCLRGPCS